MKDKIKYRLQSAWSSLLSGIDLDVATESLNRLFIEELHDVVQKNELDCKIKLQSLSDISDSFEEDMELSNSLLVEVLPELNKYREIHSNNARKRAELNSLIFRIEEQIIKNGK